MAKTVFITQIPHRRDHGSGIFVPLVNVSPAGKFGDLRILMPHSMSIVQTEDVVRILDEALQDYDYEGGDSLLMLGDPAIISVASALVGTYSSKYRILKWEKTTSSYVPVEIHLPEDQEDEEEYDTGDGTTH